MSFGFLSPESTSNAFDNRIAATGTARVLTGANATSTEAGALSLRGYSHYNEKGAIDISGNKNQVGGVHVEGSKNPVTIYGSDPAVLRTFQSLNDQNQRTLSDVVASSQAQSENEKSLMGQLFDKLTQFGETKQTGIFQQPMLWLGLGFLIVLGLALTKRK